MWSAVGGGSTLTISAGTGIEVSTVSDVATVSTATTVAMKADLPTPDGTTITASNGVWSAVGGSSVNEYYVIEKPSNMVLSSDELALVYANPGRCAIHYSNAIWYYCIYDETYAGLKHVLYAENIVLAANAQRHNITTYEYDFNDQGVCTVNGNRRQINIEKTVLPFFDSTLNGYILTVSNGSVKWANKLPVPDGTTITASGNVWSAVGGGGGNGLYIIPYTGQTNGSQLTQEQQNKLLAMIDSPATAEEVEWVDSTNYRTYKFLGLNGAYGLYFWDGMHNATINVDFTNSNTSVGAIHKSEASANVGGSPLSLSNIYLASNTQPNPSASTTTDMRSALQWLHSNFPVADGTTITTSGNIWSAVGGGSVTAPIEFESPHEEGDEYNTVSYGDSSISMQYMALDVNDEYVSTAGLEIGNTGISVHVDGLGSAELNCTEISISNDDCSVTLSPENVNVHGLDSNEAVLASDNLGFNNAESGESVYIAREAVQLNDESYEQRLALYAPVVKLSQLALESPNGDLWLINVDNSGNLSATLWEDPTEPIEPDPEEPDPEEEPEE